MMSQITSLTVVYSGADQRKHLSYASLAFVKGIHRWLLNSPLKGPVKRKMFPFYDFMGHVNLAAIIGMIIQMSYVLSQRKSFEDQAPINEIYRSMIAGQHVLLLGWAVVIIIGFWCSDESCSLKSALSYFPCLLVSYDLISHFI